MSSSRLRRPARPGRPRRDLLRASRARLPRPARLRSRRGQGRPRRGARRDRDGVRPRARGRVRDRRGLAPGSGGGARGAHGRRRVARGIPGGRRRPGHEHDLAAGQPRDARGRGAARRELSRRAGQRRRAVPDRGGRGARGVDDLHGRRRRGRIRARRAGDGGPRPCLAAPRPAGRRDHGQAHQQPVRGDPRPGRGGGIHARRGVRVLARAPARGLRPHRRQELLHDRLRRPAGRARRRRARLHGRAAAQGPPPRRRPRPRAARPLPLNALAIDAWERLRAQGRGANDVTDAVFFSAEQARRDLGPRPAPTDRAPADARGRPRR